MADDLVHVVVAIRGEPPDEGDTALLARQGLIALEQRLVLLARDRIVGIALGLRVFAGDAGARVLFAGQVLVLGDPGVGHRLVGIVHHGHRLEPFLVQRLVLEPQRTVRQLAVAVAEVLVDRAGEHQVPVRIGRPRLGIVGAEQQIDVRMIEHAFEHPRVALGRHGLELVAEIARIGVGAGRHARGDRLVELARVESPLLAGVAAEEGLVEFASHRRDHHILRGPHHADRFRARGEECGGGLVRVER